MSAGVISHIALWFVSLLNLALILVIYRQFGLSAMASAAGHDNDGVPVGDVAPSLLLQQNGASTNLIEVPTDGTWSIVLFATPHCEPCVVAMDGLDQAMSRLPHGIRVLAALNGIPESIDEFKDAKSYRFDILLDSDGATMSAFQVKVTPFLMLLDPGRRVRSKALASTENRLQTFLDTVDDIIRRDSPVPASSPQHD